MASAKGETVISPDITNIVRYLKTTNDENSPCFYHNISSLVDNALSERCKDNNTFLVEFHDERSKHKRIVEESGSSRTQASVEAELANCAEAEKQMKLFEKTDDDSGDIAEREDQEFEIPLVDCCRTGNLFEQAGIGFGQEETLRVFLALKALALECTFVNVRFWGKMFGIQANYYIAETEYREGKRIKKFYSTFFLWKKMPYSFITS